MLQHRTLLNHQDHTCKISKCVGFPRPTLLGRNHNYVKGSNIVECLLDAQIETGLRAQLEKRVKALEDADKRFGELESLMRRLSARSGIL